MECKTWIIWVFANFGKLNIALAGARITHSFLQAKTMTFFLMFTLDMSNMFFA